MKYKLLLTGNNKTIISEFFNNMEFAFECLSTSMRYDDIMNHVKYVNPDAIVCCLDREKADDIRRFVNIGHKLSDQYISFVVIGENEDCREFLKIAHDMEVMMLKRPISTQNIRKEIISLLDKQNLKGRLRKKEQEKKEQEETVSKEAEKEERREVSDKDISKKAKKFSLEADEALKEAEALLAGKLPPRRKHILVVDDDRGVLKLLKRYLADKYDVATAISGKVALKFLERRETDLVLLDYEMPVENGPSVLNKIRSDEKTNNLPVVFLTGVSEKKKIQEVLEMKPQGYLLKPINMERLSAMLDKILGPSRS